MPVPVALAEMNGGLRTGQKSVSAVLITSGINCPSEIELRGSSCLLIDGLALVSAIGRPFADSFQAAVLQAGSRCQHIHGIFDRYQGFHDVRNVVVAVRGFVDEREVQSSERAIDLCRL